MDERIVIDPAIQHGKPMSRGTRVPVARIVCALAGGMTQEVVLREYDVAADDVQAALAYAVQLLEGEMFHPLPTPTD